MFNQEVNVECQQSIFTLQFSIFSLIDAGYLRVPSISPLHESNCSESESQVLPPSVGSIRLRSPQFNPVFLSPSTTTPASCQQQPRSRFQPRDSWSVTRRGESQHLPSLLLHSFGSMMLLPGLIENDRYCVLFPSRSAFWLQFESTHWFNHCLKFEPLAIQHALIIHVLLNC